MQLVAKKIRGFTAVGFLGALLVYPCVSMATSKKSNVAVKKSNSRRKKIPKPSSYRNVTLPAVDRIGVQNRPETAFGVAGANLASPNAMGGLGASVFLGLSVVTNWSGSLNTPSGEVDGNMSGGFGFGNAKKYVGVTVGAVNDSLGFRSRFLKNGGFSLRVNRYITDNLAVAVGMNNVVGWGAFRSIANSYYGVVTGEYDKIFRPLTLSVGAGTGSFDSAADTQAGNDGNVYPFTSLGVGIIQNFSGIVDWTAKKLNLGFALTPPISKSYPMALTFGFMNVTKGPAGSKSSFSVSGVISHTF